MKAGRKKIGGNGIPTKHLRITLSLPDYIYEWLAEETNRKYAAFIRELIYTEYEDSA